MAALSHHNLSKLDASTSTMSSMVQESDLSSILSTLSSSELSALSASEAEQTDDEEFTRPCKRIRRRAAELEIAEIETDQSSADEDASGALRLGHKRYLCAGLYSRDNKMDLDGKESGLSKVQNETPLAAIPLALPADDAILTDEVFEKVPTFAKRGNGTRASSVIASNKFARNGLGPSSQGVTHLIRKKALPKAKKEKSPAEYTGPIERSTAADSYQGPLLPLPINFGETLLAEQRDFKLPYSIQYNYRENGPGRVKMLKQGGRGKRPARFMNLQKNIYPERSKALAATAAVCDCPRGSKCDQDCFNRMMQYLCSTKLCPARRTCTNIPLHERDPLLTPDGDEGAQIFWTGNRGFGLRTKVDASAGTFIMEYTGEVISRDESYRRVLDVYRDRSDFYFLNCARNFTEGRYSLADDGDEVIDAGLKGNLARFANHSCDPNCKMIRFRFAEFQEYQIGLFAVKDIKAGSELCYDYGWVNFASLTEEGETLALTDKISQEKARQRCFCGADLCTGYLGGKRKGKK